MEELTSDLPNELNFLLKGRAPGKRQVKPVSIEKAQASLAWVKDICGDDDDDDEEVVNEELEEAKSEEDEDLCEEEEEENEEENGDGNEDVDDVDELENDVDADEDVEMKCEVASNVIDKNDNSIGKASFNAKVKRATEPVVESASSLPAGLSFLLKSRAPGKRQVKPVSAEKAAFLADFAGSDDDDQDFEVGEEPNDDASLSDDDEDDKSYSPGAGRDEDESQLSDGSDVEITKEERIPIHIDLDNLDHESSLSSKTGQEILLNKGPKISETLVCLVCLKDTNDDKDNELVQCDGCGIACHVLCYGIGENSDDGNDSGRDTPLSSASTEPWFCDSCRSGDDKPICQLCPNEGGAFKLTDSGHWVHLVCALYTGCSFGEVGALSRININTIKQKRWGSRVCSLCQDAQYASTGVCISCDAGMCRMFFHVTCAQREGLLADAPVAVAASVLTSSMQSPLKQLPRAHRDDYSSDEESKRKPSANAQEVADPFYACCKRHSNPESTKRNKRNFMAAYRICNTFKQEDRWELAIGRERYERKLFQTRAKFLSRTRKAMRNYTDSAPVTLCYQSRPFTSCPLAVKKAVIKAKLGGVDEEQLVMSPSANNSAAASASHYSPLSFSSRFVQYFEARNRRIDELVAICSTNESQQTDATREEAELKKTYEVLYQSVRRHRDQGDRYCAEATEIHASISDMLNRYFRTDNDSPEATFAVPPLPAELTVITDRKQFETELKETAGITIYECFTCKQTRDQHMFMQCDTCKRRFHCFCLDPPLTQPWTGPKTSRRSSAKWSWECHFCCPSSTDSDVVKPHVNVDAPRQLRREIKAPVRFIVASEEPDKDSREMKPPTAPPSVSSESTEDKTNGRKVVHSKGNGSRKRSRGGVAGEPAASSGSEKQTPSSPSKKQQGKRQRLTPPATPPKFTTGTVLASPSKNVDATVYDFSSDSE